MGILKKDFKYKYIENFLSKEEVEFGLRYFLLKHKRNQSSFDFQQSNNRDSCFRDDDFTDALFITKLKKVEKETGLELLPSYTYSRVYSYNAELPSHVDRDPCEVSITMTWGSCGTPWPIFIDNNEIHIKPGDAVIYLGCDLEHYRKHFEGDYHVQSFFHYVDKNDNKSNNVFENRPYHLDPTINFTEHKYYGKKT